MFYKQHTFKTRYNNDKLSFEHRKNSHDTVLCKYIWDLKDNNNALISRLSGLLLRKQIRSQPRSQGLSSLPTLVVRPRKAEKRDPGNEVGPFKGIPSRCNLCLQKRGSYKGDL